MPISNPSPPGASITHGGYTGNDAVNRAIPHGLGKVPRIVIIRYQNGTSLHCIFTGDAYMCYWEAANQASISVTAPTDVDFYIGNAGDYFHSANANTKQYKWVAIG